MITVSVIVLCSVFRFVRKFGFPFRSGSTEFRSICSPYCYCAGVHLREDHTGTLKVLPCSECCCGAMCCCERPPPELMTPVDFRWTGPIVYHYTAMINRVGIHSHNDVVRIMQQPHRVVVTTQPNWGQKQNVHPPSNKLEQPFVVQQVP